MFSSSSSRLSGGRKKKRNKKLDPSGSIFGGRDKKASPSFSSFKNKNPEDKSSDFYFLAEGTRFELARREPAGFQDQCLKPLGHPSADYFIIIPKNML